MLKDKNMKARDWLDDSSKTEFENFLDEAMLNDFERAVCCARKKGKSNTSITFDLHCSASTVDRAVAKIYRMANKIVL